MRESIQNGRAPWQIVPVQSVGGDKFIDGRRVDPGSVEDVAVAREKIGQTLTVVEVDMIAQKPADVIESLGVTATQVVLIASSEKSR